LGLDVLPVSATHGTGLEELFEKVAPQLPVPGEEAPVEKFQLKLCLLGRPNVGKSSLCNALAGEDRQMVSSVPGTTRDAVDVALSREGIACLLVDTPGVRRKRSVVQKLERMSVVAALRSLERADVAVVVLDATEAFTDQDARLLRLVHDRGRGLVVAVNKTDLWKAKQRAEYLESLKHGMRFVSYAHVATVSALKGSEVNRLLPAAMRALQSLQTRISTSDLNQFVAQANEQYQPPMVKGRRAKIYYLTQTDVCPPTFVAMVNDPRRVPRSYRRFLENRLRKRFPFPGAPLRWVFKGKKR
jgi:GTP-binding protein